jgi:hypothetical protein
MYKFIILYLICIRRRAVYLGAYNEEEAAARAYDLAALKYWGPTTYTNFPVSTSICVFFNFLIISKNGLIFSLYYGPEYAAWWHGY